MEVHFITTGDKFPYVYYLAVMSAIRTQPSTNVNIWMSELPHSGYFDRIANIAKFGIARRFDLPAITPQPSDDDNTTKIRRTHLKDLIGWDVLYEYGGVLLDLDTFCIRSLCDLLGDKEVATCIWSKQRYGPAMFPFNNAVVVARPRSTVIKETMDEAVEALSKPLSPLFLWGCSGPMAFSNAIHKNYHLVNFLQPGTFGRVDEQMKSEGSSLHEEGGELPEVTRVVHLYGAADKHKHIYSLNGDAIKNSNTLYARLIKSVLEEKDWHV